MFYAIRLLALWASSGGSGGASRRPASGDRAPRGAAFVGCRKPTRVGGTSGAAPFDSAPTLSRRDLAQGKLASLPRLTRVDGTRGVEPGSGGAGERRGCSIFSRRSLGI